jgi:hypothetical protein
MKDFLLHIFTGIREQLLQLQLDVQTGSAFARRGVRQGCILSPTPFNIYSKILLNAALEDCKGTSVNGVNVTNIRYAHDTVLLTNDAQSLQAMFDSCRTTKSYGITFSGI